MSRSPTVSDEEILRAAVKIFADHSANGFSVKKVAAEVGLSRAAIIARFNSTQDLKTRTAKQIIGTFIESLEALPARPSGDNVLELVRFIGSHFQGRRTGMHYLLGSLNSGNDSEDPELVALEKELHSAMKNATERVLPPLSIDKKAAFEIFRAHVLGTLTLWDYSGRGNPAIYLERKTKDWMKLVGIPFSQ